MCSSSHGVGAAFEDISRVLFRLKLLGAQSPLARHQGPVEFASDTALERISG